MTKDQAGLNAEREEMQFFQRCLAAELVGSELPRRRSDALAVLRLAEKILQAGEGDDAPEDPWLIARGLPA